MDVQTRINKTFSILCSFYKTGLEKIMVTRELVQPSKNKKHKSNMEK